MGIRRTVLSLLAATILFGSSSLPSSGQAVTPSIQGQILEDAIKRDFFTFFHLKERAIDEHEELATHYFRPGSRNDVVVCIDTDKQNKILQMAMVVGRDFIDDPKTNIFARDLVKSFLEVATPPSVPGDTRDLVNEIFFRGTVLTPSSAKSVTSNDQTVSLGPDGKVVKVGEGELKKDDVAIVMSGQIPKLPEKVSESYRAFLGEVQNSDLPITGGHVRLKNHDVSQTKLLEVRVDMDSVKKAPKLQFVSDDTEDGAETKSKPGSEESDAK
ncbi:hypothetical protein KF913_11810 [Candidatus Obscuribacterales bacterium]|nr:hypothetical protein [Candidatus Obscuribacterales bacterium]